MDGAKLESFDGSKLTDAINITVGGAGLSEIKLPVGSTKLQELSLEGNEFTSFDFSQFPALTTIAMAENNLTSVDLTKNPNVGLFSAAYNQLSEIKLNNPNLWALYLDNNNFTSIDLSGVKNLSQFSIGHNQLSEINIDVVPNLIMLVINNNNFTFKTLPLKKNLIVYYYHGQAPINAVCVDGKVDLSDQIKVGNTPTVYQWFIGVPGVNQDTGVLEGEELYIDEEYTLENGVTTFLNDFEGIMCVMTNSELPNVYIFTDLMDVKKSGVEAIEGDAASVTVNGNNVIVKCVEAGAAIKLYAVNGAEVRNAVTVAGETVLSDVAEGAYIVTVGNKVAKIVVK